MPALNWGGDDAFTHMLVVGPTRCGKTATILKPMIYQILLQKKRGVDVGLSVVEPKGELARLVREMCQEMGLPCTYLDPESHESQSFNVMEGDKDDVAEAAVVVLQSLFGKQEAFFQTVQELSTRNITKLLKELHGDSIDIMDVLHTLRDRKTLEGHVKKLRQRDGETELVQFFENELLGSLADQYRKLVIGLRAQLENITSNGLLRRVITGKSDLDIDRHFEEGGILAVNTALGKLRKAGDAFGQFVIMHLQNGTFRRKGTEGTRVPHFLIVDEYSRYINPDIEMFLSIAAEYRVSGIFATQSLGQLEVESGKVNAKAMKAAILTSCRNKICFGGLSARDAKEFAEEFGKDRIILRQSTYKNRGLLPRLFPDSYRDTEDEEYRFHFTYLMDGMPRFHYVHKLLEDGKPLPAGEAKGAFVPKDWKERREWEEGNILASLLKWKGRLLSRKAEERMDRQEEKLAPEPGKPEESQPPEIYPETRDREPDGSRREAEEERVPASAQQDGKAAGKDAGAPFPMDDGNEEESDQPREGAGPSAPVPPLEEEDIPAAGKNQEDERMAEGRAGSPASGEQNEGDGRERKPSGPLEPVREGEGYNDRDAWF